MESSSDYNQSVTVRTLTATPAGVQSLSQLAQVADRALYEAKGDDGKRRESSPIDTVKT